MKPKIIFGLTNDTSYCMSEFKLFVMMISLDANYSLF